VCSQQIVEPRHILGIVALVNLMMHVMITHIKDVRDAHTPPCVVERCHKSSEDQKYHSPIDAAGHQMEGQYVQVNPAYEFERMCVDPVDSTPIGCDLSVVMLVDVGVDFSQVQPSMKEIVNCIGPR